MTETLTRENSWSADTKRESMSSFIVPNAPPDEVFLAAAEKFASWAAKEEVTEEHPIKYLRGLSDKEDFDALSTSNKRIVLDLAFSAYRFLNRLEEILIDSGFSDGAPIPDELNSLVVVMLFELTQRRFIIRGTRSKAALGPRMEEVEEVERHLDKYAVKLAASLARLRIRESSLSLADTMPDEISKSEKNRVNARIFAWPNKFNPHQIDLELDARKVEFQKGEDLTQELISFDTDSFERIESSDLIGQNKIILCDSSSLLLSQIIQNYSNNGLTLSNGEDAFNILHAGGTYNSLPALCHEVYKTGLVLQREANQKRFLFGNSESSANSNEDVPVEKPKLLICAKRVNHEILNQKLLDLGINENLFKLIPPLSTIAPNDKILMHVKMCIVEPECSLTLASDPIQYLLVEGKGTDENDKRLEAIAQGQLKPQEGMTTILQSAVSNLPIASVVVYLTRSDLSEENESVIQGIKKNGFSLSNVPIELPLEIAKSTGKFLRVPKSDAGSGFFCCCLTRNQTDPKIALKKSALKGLFVPSTTSTSTTKKGKK